MNFGWLKRNKQINGNGLGNGNATINELQAEIVRTIAKLKKVIFHSNNLFFRTK